MDLAPRLHPNPLPSQVERGRNAFAMQGSLDLANSMLSPWNYSVAVAALAAQVMVGSQKAMETLLPATPPPLAWRRKGTRGRQGDAPAKKGKGTLELLSKTHLLELFTAVL